jgi:hypothetical protein
VAVEVVAVEVAAAEVAAGQLLQAARPFTDGMSSLQARCALQASAVITGSLRFRFRPDCLFINGRSTLAWIAARCQPGRQYGQLDD